MQRHKYKGHKNIEVKMMAIMGENEKYVISGSEDGNVCIWNCNIINDTKISSK